MTIVLVQRLDVVATPGYLQLKLGRAYRGEAEAHRHTVDTVRALVHVHVLKKADYQSYYSW